jgi:hypothetical protein
VRYIQLSNGFSALQQLGFVFHVVVLVYLARGRLWDLDPVPRLVGPLVL